MKFYLMAGVLFVCPIAKGQSVSTQMGARAAGIGNISTVLSDESSLFNNPGGLFGAREKSMLATYETQTRLPGADRMACGLILPFRTATAGVGFFRFGDEVYNEQLAMLVWSQKLGATSLGVRINYIQYSAQGFGTKTAASISLGGLTQVTKQIFIGAYIVNLPIKNPSEEERLPSILIAGIGFKPTNDVFLNTEVEKNLMYGATWRAGLEYTILKKIFARTGFNINPNAGFFGLGVKSSRIKIDYSIKLSDTIGAAHQASCTYNFGKLQKSK